MMESQKEKVIRENLNIGTFICVSDKDLKCVICGNKIKNNIGNNAEPVAQGRCCDKCNVEVVKQRLIKIQGELKWKELILEQLN